MRRLAIPLMAAALALAACSTPAAAPPPATPAAGGATSSAAAPAGGAPTAAASPGGASSAPSAADAEAAAEAALLPDEVMAEADMAPEGEATTGTARWFKNCGNALASQGRALTGVQKMWKDPEGHFVHQTVTVYAVPGAQLVQEARDAFAYDSFTADEFEWTNVAEFDISGQAQGLDNVAWCQEGKHTSQDIVVATCDGVLAKDNTVSHLSVAVANLTSAQKALQGATLVAAQQLNG